MARTAVGILLVGCLALSASLRAAGARSLPYAIGDVALEDIIAPIDFEVVNPEETMNLRQEHASKVPFVFRFEAEVGPEVIHAVREEFGRVRLQFLRDLQRAANRPKLEPETVRHESFRRFQDWFRAHHPEFPLTPELSRIWALHESDEALLDDWLRPVKMVMDQWIRPDADPGDVPIESVLARVVEPRSSSGDLDLKWVETQGVTIAATNVVSLADARRQIRQSRSAHEAVLGLFLAGFIRPNSLPESDLTDAMRQKQWAGLLVVETYWDGEVIVRRGDRVSARAKAALDVLRADHRFTETASRVQDPATNATASFRSWARRWIADPLKLEDAAFSGLGWIAMLSLVATLLLAWMVHRRDVRRRALVNAAPRTEPYTVVLNPQRNETVFLPAHEATGAGASADAADGSETTAVTAADKFWLQRAREAEQRAESILSMVRAGLAPELARQMMHGLVRELITQRSEWLQTQQIVENDLDEIEKRFVKSHEQLRDRLRAFEERTLELEEALAKKTQENSELLKAQIALTQQQMNDKPKPDSLSLWN